MHTKERVDKFYKDLEKLGLKKPVATISRETGFGKSTISQYLNKKKEPSENFLDLFYEKFPFSSPTNKKGDSWEPPLDDLIEEKAILKTLVNHIIKLEAIVYTRPVEDVRRDFKLDTNLLLDELTGGAVSKA